MPQLPFSQSPIYSYDLQTNYKRDVWLYKHGHYDGLNSEIDQFDWNSHLSSLNDIDEELFSSILNHIVHFISLCPIFTQKRN